MPAPWYRHMRCMCPADHAHHCGPDVSALAIQPGSEAGDGVPRKDYGEPMADMLDWLMHYDFQDGEDRAVKSDDCHEEEDDICNEFIHEESTREETESPDFVLMQMPRNSTTPQREPGRLLQKPTTGTEASLQPPQTPTKAGSQSKVSPPAAPVKSAVSPTKSGSPTSTDASPATEDVGDKVRDESQSPGSPHCGSLDLDINSAKGACSPLRAMGAQGGLLPPDGTRAGAGSGAGRDFFEDEEEEWEMRKRYSGPVGRLVAYHEGDNPKDDIVLRGGGRHHIVVAGIREGGPAAKMGVRAGDRLVSINGKRSFTGQLASVVQENLRSPAIMVFIGFVGKLQAEVRLARVDDTAGLPSRQKLVLGMENTRFQLCEERIFDVGNASIFLSLPTNNRPDVLGGGGSYAGDLAVPVFELQRGEAHCVLKCALRKLKVKGHDAEAMKAAAEKSAAKVPPVASVGQAGVSSDPGQWEVPTLQMPTHNQGPPLPVEENIGGSTLRV